MNGRKEDVKEEFCAPCLLAIPAMMGAGGAAASGSEKNKKTRKIILWVSIALTGVSIILYIYFKTKCKNCR